MTSEAKPGIKFNLFQPRELEDPNHLYMTDLIRNVCHEIQDVIEANGQPIRAEPTTHHTETIENPFEPNNPDLKVTVSFPLNIDGHFYIKSEETVLGASPKLYWIPLLSCKYKTVMDNSTSPMKDSTLDGLLAIITAVKDKVYQGNSEAKNAPLGFDSRPLS